MNVVSATRVPNAAIAALNAGRSSSRRGLSGSTGPLGSSGFQLALAPNQRTSTWSARSLCHRPPAVPAASVAGTVRHVVSDECVQARRGRPAARLDGDREACPVDDAAAIVDARNGCRWRRAARSQNSGDRDALPVRALVCLFGDKLDVL